MSLLPRLLVIVSVLQLPRWWYFHLLRFEGHEKLLEDYACNVLMHGPISNTFIQNCKTRLGLTHADLHQVQQRSAVPVRMILAYVGPMWLHPYPQSHQSRTVMGSTMTLCQLLPRLRTITHLQNETRFGRASFDSGESMTSGKKPNHLFQSKHRDLHGQHCAGLWKPFQSENDLES